MQTQEYPVLDTEELKCGLKIARYAGRYFYLVEFDEERQVAPISVQDMEHAYSDHGITHLIVVGLIPYLVYMPFSFKELEKPCFEEYLTFRAGKTVLDLPADWLTMARSGDDLRGYCAQMGSNIASYPEPGEAEEGKLYHVPDSEIVSVVHYAVSLGQSEEGKSTSLLLDINGQMYQLPFEGAFHLRKSLGKALDIVAKERGLK